MVDAVGVGVAQNQLRPALVDICTEERQEPEPAEPRAGQRTENSRRPAVDTDTTRARWSPRPAPTRPCRAEGAGPGPIRSQRMNSAPAFNLRRGTDVRPEVRGAVGVCLAPLDSLGRHVQQLRLQLLPDLQGHKRRVRTSPQHRAPVRHLTRALMDSSRDRAWFSQESSGSGLKSTSTATSNSKSAGEQRSVGLQEPAQRFRIGCLAPELTAWKLWGHRVVPDRGWKRRQQRSEAERNRAAATHLVDSRLPLGSDSSSAVRGRAGSVPFPAAGSDPSAASCRAVGS